MELQTIEKPDISGEEFEMWRRFIHERSGLDFPESRKRYMTQNLWVRMEALGVTRYDDYKKIVDQDSSNKEWLKLLSHLVNTETNFFRHLPSFEAFTGYALPEIFKECQATGRNSISIWSAGCSTGQETYSLAMAYLSTVAAYPSFSNGSIPEALVTGSDIVDASLDKARQGNYKLHELRHLPETYRDAYMVKVEGAKEVSYEISGRVKKITQFYPLDLNESFEEWPIDQDVIYCHNVLMHLDPSLKTKIIDQLCKQVRPGGFLFLSPSENVGVKPKGMRPIQQKELVLYQRV